MAELKPATRAVDAAQLRSTADMPTSVAWRLLLIARLLAAVLSNISDCDEVFNYWEPAHYLLKGSGWQLPFPPSLLSLAMPLLAKRIMLAMLLILMAQAPRSLFHCVV